MRFSPAFCAMPMRAGECIRLELGACEALHGLGEGLLLFGEGELHVGLSGACYTTFVMSDTLGLLWWLTLTESEW